ncbi:MAG: hypothetical protein IJO85_02475 [Lachnospiraceae bacterium]|nr:hypothetical protein [Lachnospiraceae bacterium]
MINRVKNLLEKYIVEIAVSLYLLYLLYINVAETIYGYVNVWYVLDYSYGFGSRLMLGSLLHLFTGDFLEEETAYHFVIAMLGILCVLISVLAGMVYRKIKDDNRKLAALFLIAFYLASPASPAYLWTRENMGRLDTYLFISAVIMAMIYMKVKNRYVKYALFLAIGVFTISIHQVYIFLFFPSLLVMMIHDVWQSGFEKKQILMSLSTAVILGCVFLYMQFCSGIYYDNLDELVAELSSHTSIGLSVPPLEAEYFWTIKDHFYKNQLPELRERIRFGIITVVLLTPIWGTYLWLWIQAIKSSKDALAKSKYILMLLTNVAYVPVFALMNDWGRWFAAFFIVQFLSMMVLAYVGDEGIVQGLEKLGKAIRKNSVIFLVFILYVASFEKFQGLNYLEQVERFYYSTYDLKEWILGR